MKQSVLYQCFYDLAYFIGLTDLSQTTLLKEVTVLSPRFGTCDPDFLKAAALLSLAACFPTLTQCSSVKLIYFHHIGQDRFLLSSRTPCTTLLTYFVCGSCSDVYRKGRNRTEVRSNGHHCNIIRFDKYLKQVEDAIIMISPQ